MCDDEYYHRCDKLYYLILRAYVDKYLLSAIEVNNCAVKQGNIALGKWSFNVLGHICELIKCDFALIIWKTAIDEDLKANTFKQLGRYIHEKNHGEKVSTKLPKKYKTVCSNINSLRNKFLAHDDFERANIAIHIDDLSGILDELKNMYNSLCDSNIDDRVRQITEKDIGAIGINSTFGFLSMIQGGSVNQTKEVHKGGDDECLI